MKALRRQHRMAYGDGMHEKPVPDVRDKLDATPMLAAIDRAGGVEELTRHLSVDERASMLKRVRDVRHLGWIGVYSADRLCIRLLNTNPALIFGGRVWWESVRPEAEAA